MPTKKKKDGPPTKAAALKSIADRAGVTKKVAAAVMEALGAEMAASLKRHGKFKLNGWLNLATKRTPAKPARDGINPFTKEPMRFKAKPAGFKVTARALKPLKDMVQ